MVGTEHSKHSRHSKYSTQMVVCMLCKNSTWPTSTAAEHGHIECLECLLELTEYAAAGLDQKFTPWDPRGWATRSAAANGHLDCLAFAHQHGAPLDELASVYAARQGNVMVPPRGLR